MPEELIDVSGLWGAVEGYVISALEAPRASISTLARHFGFDAVESEGRIKFLMRGRIASLTIAPDSMVAPSSAQGDVMELTRAQETELPQALKWQVARADEDYDAAQVEARRITVDTTRIASEAFPIAVPPEEAERRCRRALMEAWVGRESAVFRLPPSSLALDPCDVILFDHDGRLTEMRLVSIADSDLRSVDAVRQDRAVYDLPPGEPRPASLSTPTVFGAPDVVFLDLPQLREDQPAHRPMVAAHAKPWPGEIAVYRSAATDGFALLTTFGTRARMGVLAADFYAGPVSRFDLGNALVIDLYSGTLESVTDIALLGGANALTVETGAGHWEIIQAGTAELIAPGRYRLTRLLRGQRGTEHAIVGVVATGARVVVLDTALATLPISEADLGLPWNWRTGPASKPVSDETFVATTFTPEGAGLRPFSVGHVEQPWRTARNPGDLTIRWTRRSRSLAADTWGAGDVPLAEDSEAYEVEIRDGGAVKRTLSTTTNLSTSMRRWRVTSAATVDAVAEERSAGWVCWRGNADGLGGWSYVNRLSMTTLQATGMGFFGLYGSTAALATTLTLAAAVNCIGIGFQRGTHTNWQLVHNDGSGAPTLTDLGSSFPVASTTIVLSLYIAASPNGSDVGLRVVEEVSGTAVEFTITTDMPAATQLLSPRNYMNTGATAAAVAYDCSGVYVETDF
ncbi:hypothetical protein DSM107133_03410 [Pseudosulfitobacter sp. DSM 107133]|nr:hypothetical protein DSM107133_03410 [Pseudosulfitobacter sp. DSM 107133]